MDWQAANQNPQRSPENLGSNPKVQVTNEPASDGASNGSFAFPKWIGDRIVFRLALLGLLAAAALMGYFLGNRGNTRPVEMPVELLHASATHSSSSMAVATGKIDQDSEGIFFLDYLTGDLQCWVFYPRTGQFGAKFTTNVTAQLPGGKNAEYIMVTGNIVVPQAGGNARLANSLVYVVDSRAGLFAAYGVPWNRSMENSGQAQLGQLVPVGGGQIRNPGGGIQPAPGANPANPPNGNP